jgi:CBS domain containing-hemolysin-like protein
MAFPDLCARLELSVDDDEGEETVAGWLTAQLGRLAKVGDAVALGEWTATVQVIGRHRIGRIRLERTRVQTTP